MAMDDPWGSPWADEIQTPHPAKPKADDFAVKPTTPVKAASLALEQKTNSPWDDTDDDDGFGDWTVGSAEGGSGLGLDRENDGWGRNTEHGLELDLTNGGSSTPSVQWKDGAVVSEDGMSKLAPSLLAKSDVLRQPSPDPWAVGTDRDDEYADATPLSAEQHDEGDFVQELIAGVAPGEVVSTGLEPVAVTDDALPETIGTDHGVSTTNDANDVVEESNNPNGENIETLVPVETAHQNGDILEPEHVSSRPSSSPSEHSHHDEMAQDSPRTSLDEEPKRPPVPRKVSSKVQDLVQHFDGLTQQEAAEPVIGTAGSPQQTNEDAEEEKVEIDDFGDFEDVQSEIEEPLDEGKADPPANSPTVEDSNANSREPVTKQEEPRALFVRKDLGPVEFIIDTSAFDRLYSDKEAKPHSEKVFVPDIVPHDSFLSTEERKTWYRISRYGTMRKYNTGDDENYVRANWTKSQIRAETLKIVARWIEEDRISGRVVLGGASKGSSIFGWNDSKAVPVPPAHAFAAKNGKQKIAPAASEPAVEIPREWPKGLVTTRSTSRTPSLSKSRRGGSTKSVASEEIKPGTHLPVANFGWNVTPQDVHESKAQLPIHGKKLSGSSFSSPPPTTKMSPAQQPAPSQTSSPVPIEPTKRVTGTNGMTHRPHSMAHTTLSARPSLTTSNLTNEDDDWGELVSSPSTNIPPVILPSAGPYHKTTRSLGSALPSTSILPVINNPISPLKPIESDHWAMGSDEVLQPQNRNSRITSTPNIFTQNTFTTSNDDYLNGAFEPAAQTANQAQAAISVDPWASADFSFFETPATTVSNVTPALVTTTMPPKTVTFSTPSITSFPRRGPKSREEIEQDRIVQSVIKGLPDLSYMLRR